MFEVFALRVLTLGGVYAPSLALGFVEITNTGRQVTGTNNPLMNYVHLGCLNLKFAVFMAQMNPSFTKTKR